ncbi:metallo-beta-lactamase domain protein [Melanomma pulvis-pyrius CBS 109.77]|uniref:Metallo-beta-lactamase domain protein n=1 Tax=Melanomma pulvis-pyrius CBS 109.77 TaxID=1314802 RepID=A0A6A6XTA4_9PLEO|nr:metallo-beta-lactamase domain protein [Melanomma pulvis-pyrius CBS 109.77]
MCQDHYSVDNCGNVSTVNATYIEPSAKTLLMTGQKIIDIFTQNVTKPYILQRLTERCYFFGGGFYTTLFYVGDEGVLLFDPVENQGTNILKAIKEVTPLPVTAIVYSHNHADHICSTPDILKETSNDVRIIASEATITKMKLLDCKFPTPTEVVQWPTGALKFESVTVQLYGFEHAAHTDDASAWLLVEEEVCHCPDLINGDQPPFWRFGTAENYVYFQRNVEELGKLAWKHATLGHGNVGSKEDVKFVLEFLADLDAAVKQAMGAVSFAVVGNMSKYTNHAALMMTWQKAIRDNVMEVLRPKYGKTYGFEVSTPANIEMVILRMLIISTELQDIKPQYI